VSVERLLAGDRLAGGYGIPNELTAEGNHALQQMFNGLGGVDAMLVWARQHKNLFREPPCLTSPIDTAKSTLGS
jgi:hypothetical protein